MRPRLVSDTPDVFEDSTLLRNPDVQEARRKIQQAGSVEAADLSKFNPRVQDLAVRTWKLPDDLDLPFYAAAWKRLKRHFAMPRLSGYAHDLAVMLGQPEVQNVLLARWQDPAPRLTGPKTAWSGSKAVLLVMAALGIGPHVDDNYEVLVGHANVQRVCAWALAEAQALAGRTPEPFRLATHVASVLRHFQPLVATLGRLPVEANIQMLRSLAAMHPDQPICVVGAVDGNGMPAWARQRAGRSPEDEAQLSKRTPNAGFRAHTQRNGRKEDLQPGEAADARYSKFWRGYHLIVLVDYCTGRPIVWTLVNNKWDEAKQLRTLLQLLFELWPDCPLKTIVGDGAYDQKWAHELCEVGYGIHLVASRTSDEGELNARHYLSERESDVIAYFDGRGQAFCRLHDEPMKLLGNEAPKRDGLAPGEEAPEGQFRLRFKCEHKTEDGRDDSCGTPGLQMARHWTALAYYPHTPNGKAKRHAERLALLTHRNAVESAFNALKVGKGLATESADRLRLTDFETVVALLDLSFCMGTALLLGQERNRLGIGYDQPEFMDERRVA